MPDESQLPKGFKWEIVQPDIEVGWNLPEFKRAVGPLVALDPDEYVAINGYRFKLKEATDGE